MTSEDAKRQKLIEQAVAIAKAAGVEVDVEALKETEFSERQNRKLKQEFRNAGETLLQREHYKHGTTVKRCKNCGGEFITTYCYHQFCSDLCMVEEFKRHFGVDPRRLVLPHNEWPTEPVGSVPAVMTKWLYHWAKDLVEKFEALSQDQFESLDTDDPEPADFGSPVVGTSSDLDLTASLSFDLDFEVPVTPVIEQEKASSVPQASPPDKPDTPTYLEDISFDL